VDILREWWSYAGEPLCSSASEEQRRRGWCVSPDIGLAACEGQGRKGRAEIAPDCHVAGSVSIAIEFTCSAAPLTPVYIYSSSPRAFTLSRCAQHWSDQGSLNEHIATPAALASRRERPMRHAMRTLHENPTHAPLTSAHARRFPPRRLAHVGCVSYPRVGIVTLGATACTAITESPRLTRDSVKLFARSALRCHAGVVVLADESMRLLGHGKQFILHRCGACHFLPPTTALWAAIAAENGISNASLAAAAQRVLDVVAFL